MASKKRVGLRFAFDLGSDLIPYTGQTATTSGIVRSAARRVPEARLSVPGMKMLRERLMLSEADVRQATLLLRAVLPSEFDVPGYDDTLQN